MTEIEYVCCFNCGHARVKSRFSMEPFSIKPTDFYVLRVRRQVGGRSEQGFFDVPEKARSIVDLFNSDDPEEKELVEVLKQRLLTIVKSYIGAGIIAKDEI